LEAVRRTFWLVDLQWRCPTLFVKISTFVGQTGGYGIGIAGKKKEAEE
jgi:hypothetical protein